MFYADTRESTLTQGRVRCPFGGKQAKELQVETKEGQGGEGAGSRHSCRAGVLRCAVGLKGEVCFFWGGEGGGKGLVLSGW